MERLLQPVDLPADLRDDVCAFLLVFSRFEYALKECGYAEMRGHHLTVDRKRLEERLDARFREARDDFLAATSVLRERPPRRQILRDDHLAWVDEEMPREVTMSSLLELTYQVRNNLFHGGKWPVNPRRDQELLRAGLAVISECLDLDAELAAAYGV